MFLNRLLYYEFLTIFSFCCLISSFICLKEETLLDTQTTGLIAAFGDFDSDRFTDVFFISQNGKSFQLLKSYEKNFGLKLWPNINCWFNYSDEIISDIIPGDFNGDAMMDVMIITQPNKNTLDHFNIWIFKGDRVSLDCNNITKNPLINNAKSHPLILDFNGDMIADFIIETDDCKRELWTFTNKQFIKNCPANLQPPSPNETMRFPNSNAFVNIQNCNSDTIDFSTDIFISGKNKMEYLFFEENGFSSFSRVIVAYPDQDKFVIGQSTFIDINIDGCIEHIIPVCELIPGTEVCDPQILWYNYQERKWVKISDFNDSSNQTNVYFEVIKSLYGFDLPITVHFGDVDGDGYVDLVSVMKNSKIKKTSAIILKNVKDDSLPGKRKFMFFWSSDELVSEPIELASFLDVEENGKLDIIMTIRNSSNHYKIIWIRNIFMESSCFLKVLVTTGLCQTAGSCPDEKVPYGTNMVGPFVCYETSDVNGLLIKGCANQLSQSSHFALQMPYSIFGLGETPNFVETVVSSIPSGDMKQVRKAKWTQIVPDAQVVLIPYPPNETEYWICKLFYTPSSIVFSTLATLGVLCCVLVIIILILHRKEVQEDITEHEEYKRHWPESR